MGAIYSPFEEFHITHRRKFSKVLVVIKQIVLSWAFSNAYLSDGSVIMRNVSEISQQECEHMFEVFSKCNCCERHKVNREKAIYLMCSCHVGKLVCTCGVLEERARKYHISNLAREQCQCPCRKITRELVYCRHITSN